MGDTCSIDKERYLLSPDLNRLLKSQTRSTVRLKQYRIKDEIFHDLGYYDDSILNALNGNEDAFEDMIEKWVSQPIADQLSYLP